ncbi:coiled-coil domain-containing protein 149 [Spodoptera litura]|uniref:Coiled-coil domain-containing protein 149 n=1 Tax=Spodoptera litura TaxID=69820 RepID=A0A9J7EUE7_SPOLT|nr:coiled-coil domain-containing protein 149 [Spodoptera litura]
MFHKSSLTKVKFQDQQLDDYVLENSVLKSKLQSKIDALSIMSRELDKCSMERDRFKVLVEQLMCKKTVPMKSSPGANNVSYRLTPTNTITGGEMLAKTQDHNNMLKLEVESLKSKLEEAKEDIVALKKQLQKRDSITDEMNGHKKSSTIFSYSHKDYEQLVNELEKNQKKYQQMQLDYRATLDEKEELVSDRDYYKNKVQRLSHQISYILSNRTKLQDSNDVDPPKPIVDIDALVTENKYLHERITQLQVEKEIIKRTLTKYKTLLDNRSKNYSLQMKKGFADVMTQKQVREFLDNIYSKAGLKQGSAAELKSLCLGLFEALNDKSIALQHQRKTNQILANRITELEKTLESWCNGQKYIPIFPSQMLMDEFLTDSGSVKSNDSKEQLKSHDSSENNRNKFSDSDDEMNKDTSDGSSGDLRKTYDDDEDEDDVEECQELRRNMSKTVLPQDLQDLVKEALAELKPAN